MDEVAIGALANFATSISKSEDQGVVATLTKANAQLARQLEES
jgi:hypothetical protein